MSPQSLKFATCTPVAFRANDNFFSRDTGLICRELQKLGHQCKVIMPFPLHEDDLPCADLLRTEKENLYSCAWWQQQELDGVILYSWGDPRYNGIARAIRAAGVKLCVHFDSSGELHEHLTRKGNRWLNRVKDYAVNLLRRRHLDYASFITCSAPCINAFRYDKRYGSSIADKCKEFPTPVESCFCYNEQQKQPRIICVGSWQLPVKRVEMLVHTLQQTLTHHPTAQADICGKITPALQLWHDSLPLDIKSRTRLHGMCTHEQLSRLYNAASISLCTSESEGSHGASAEALCCGCSVVCPPRPLLSVVRWYTSRDSGTVSTEDTPESLSAALLYELGQWQQGIRSASSIAAAWQPCFQVRRLLNYLSDC